MKVAIGSKNPVKVRAVQNAFPEPGNMVLSVEVDSCVRSQPLSHDETRTGAIHRAKGCLQITDAVMGIGLEGGVFVMDEQLYLCNWGALVDRDMRLFVVGGPTLKLPDHFRGLLEKGKELNEVMHREAGIEGLGSKEGAIGYYTQGRITRDQVFTQMVQILRGQHLFYTSQLAMVK